MPFGVATSKGKQFLYVRSSHFNIYMHHNTYVAYIYYLYFTIIQMGMVTCADDADVVDSPTAEVTRVQSLTAMTAGRITADEVHAAVDGMMDGMDMEDNTVDEAMMTTATAAVVAMVARMVEAGVKEVEGKVEGGIEVTRLIVATQGRREKEEDIVDNIGKL